MATPRGALRRIRTPRRWLPLVAGLLLAACDSDNAGFPADHCLVDCIEGDEILIVAPSQSLLLTGSERALTATLVAADGIRRDVTAVVDWTSGNSAIATVSAGGIVQGVAPGATNVTAALPTFSARAEIAVTDLGVDQLVISPAYRRLLPGLGQQYTATAVLSNGSTVDVTSVVAWSVGNSAVASIDADGLATALAEGETTVNASYVQGAMSLAGTATLAVRSPIVTIDTFYVDPLSATTVPTGRVAFRAFVVTSENETFEVSADVSWLSTNGAVASIDSDGIAAAHAAGVTSIQATLTYLGQPHLAVAELVVIAPSLAELRISPDWAERLVGQQQAYTATAVFAGGRTTDVTERVLWQSLSPAIATIDPQGVASALAPGQTTIAASLTFEGISGSGDGVLVVDSPPPVLQSLSVVPPDATVLADDDLQYACIAAFSDGSRHDVTGRCLWSTGDPAIAVVDGIGGLLTGIDAGSTSVNARWIYQGVAALGTATVEVIEPVTVASLQVTPAVAQSIVLGTQQFEAHALLTDGRKIDVTRNVAWTSDDATIAEIDPTGLAHARSPGETPIRAAVSHLGVDFADAATLTVTPLPVSVVEFRVVPPRQLVHAGGLTRFKAELLLSNDATLDITDLVLWSALDPAIARTTEQNGEFIGLQPGQTPVEAIITYQGITRSSRGELLVVDPDLRVIGLEIEPPSPVLLVGRQRQLQALLLLGTGDAVDVTRRVLWSSADSGIAAIDAQGLSTGISAGTTELTALAQAGSIDETDSVPARVLDPATALVALRLAPPQASVPIGADTKFTAIAYYLNGARDDVSAASSWTIADTNVADLASQDGLVHTKATGVTTVSARYEANGIQRNASATLEVTAPVITITEIQISPLRLRVASGNSAIFHATAILSDFSHVDVTRGSQWRSSDPRVAQASRQSGTFDTLQPGQVTVSASFRYQNQSYVGQATLLVAAPNPVYLEVSPPRARLTIGESKALRAILHFTDNSTDEVTDEVSWRSRDSGIAAVGAFSRPGVVTGVAAGSTTIDAVYRESLSASAGVQVTPPVLQTIDVLPATASVAAGRTQGFVAIGNYDDESAIDITDRVLWSSSDEAIAAIVAGDAQGRVLGVAPGIVMISAALDGIVGAAGLTVTPAVVVSIEVAPATARIRVDGLQAFIAVAILSDGGRREVTVEVTWTSSAPAVAGISNVPGSEGFARGLAVGTAEIRAVLGGVLQDSATLEVVEPIVNAIVVTPANQSVSVGSNVYYVATAILSDATEIDVTNYVLWTSSSPGVAAISNADTIGTATALSAGSTTIRAALGTISSGETNLTVTGACNGKPDSVFIVSDITLRVGEKAQMQITGVFPDGCMQDLTEDSATVWDSTDSDVFAIGNKTGIVTGIGPGVASAEVKHRGETDSATVTVLP
jgi:hypothetical protein